MSKQPEKIDVHSHYLPATYREQCKANGHGSPDGFPFLPVRVPLPTKKENKTKQSIQLV